jgi:hypothetical protein
VMRRIKAAVNPCIQKIEACPAPAAAVFLSMLTSMKRNLAPAHHGYYFGNTLRVDRAIGLEESDDDASDRKLYELRNIGQNDGVLLRGEPRARPPLAGSAN